MACYDSNSRDADGEDFDYSGVDDQDSNDSKNFCPTVKDANLELQSMEASDAVPQILETSDAVPQILETSDAVPKILETSDSVPPILEDSASEPQSPVDSNFDYQSADTQDSGIQTISSQDLDFQLINNQDSDVQTICGQEPDDQNLEDRQDLDTQNIYRQVSSNQSLDRGEVDIEWVKMSEETFNLLRKILSYFLQLHGYQWKTEHRSPELSEALVNDVSDSVIIVAEVLRQPYEVLIDSINLDVVFSDQSNLERYLATFADQLFLRFSWSLFCAFIAFVGELALRCIEREGADQLICVLENATRNYLEQETIAKILALGKFPNMLQFLRRNILIYKGRDDLHTFWEACTAEN